MNKEQMDGLRSEYMAATKELISAAVARNDRSNDLCPMSLRSKEDTDEALKEVAKINRKIADLCNKQRAIEQRANGAIGIPAVFGADIPNVLRVAVAGLATKCMAAVIDHDLKSVSRLASLVAGTSPDELLVVREAFRKSGTLRPHVHIEMARAMDELANISLTEGAFRSLLALEPDTECDDWMKARALVAGTGRRG